MDHIIDRVKEMFNLGPESALIDVEVRLKHEKEK
jgi:hypothetical protein